MTSASKPWGMTLTGKILSSHGLDFDGERVAADDRTLDTLVFELDARAEPEKKIRSSWRERQGP